MKEAADQLTRELESTAPGSPKELFYRRLIDQLHYIEGAGLILPLGERDGDPYATDAPGSDPTRKTSAPTAPRLPPSPEVVSVADVVTAADIAEFVTNVRNRGAEAFVFLDVANAASAGIAGHQAKVGDSTTWVYETGEEAPLILKPTPLLGARADYAAFYASVDGNNFEASYGGDSSLTNGVFTYRLALAIQNKQVVTVRGLAESLAGAAKSDRYGRMQRHRIEASNPESVVFTDSQLVRDRHQPIVITSPSLDFRGPVKVEQPLVSLEGFVQLNKAVGAVLINGDPAQLNPNGTFAKEIELELGTNTVEIVATAGRDIHARTITFEFDGNLDAITGAKRYALLIANQDYSRSKGFESLKTPLADVTRLQSVLVNKYGFLTEASLDGETVDLVLKNATEREIRAAIGNLVAVTKADDTVVIYYAGHGVQEERGSKTVGYWVPSDATSGRPDSYMHSALIADGVASMQARKVLVISDSCYSAALVMRGDEGALNADPIPKEQRAKYLHDLARQRTRILISSGSNQPVADNQGNGHSYFNNALISALETVEAGEAFTAGELFYKSIRPSIMQLAPQEPQYRVIPDSEHLGGDVVFARVH
ncbi:MAG: caspase family protein [Pirellulaceae bacterium]